MSLIYQASEDSYFLSEILIKLKNKLKNKKILEIGSGSGIQLQTLNSLGAKNILGADINKDAVKKCKSLGFNCFQSDLFKNINGKYDFIIFNPPYLPKNEKEPEDSQTATTGGKKGSEIINRFLKNARKYLNKNGKILLLTSSLTNDINWLDYNKKKIAEKKFFFETLYLWEITS